MKNGRKRNKTLPDFSRHIKHQGNDRGVIVAVDDEAHLAESSAEVGGVF